MKAPEEDKSTRNGLSYLGVLLGTMACAVWMTCPASFIADDSYFYLVVARNLARYGEETFNRIIPTNGFHPLWQYTLAFWAWLAGLINDTWVDSPRCVVPIASLMLGLGCWAFARLAREYGLPLAPLVGIPFLFLTCLGNLGSEAHVHFLALGLLLLCRSRMGLLGLRRGVAVGAAAALLVLSRLDSVFVSIALIGSLLIDKGTSFRDRARIALLALGTMAVCLAPSLLYNFVRHGGFVPVSGWMKSSFPHYYPKGLVPFGLATGWMGYCVLWGWVPIALGFAVGVWAWQRKASIAPLILALAFGNSLHALYVALFTRSHTMWVWYYVDSIVLLGVSAGWLLATYRIWLPGNRTSLIATTILLALVAIGRYRRPGCEAEREQTALLQSLPPGSAVLVSDWPGAGAFYSSAHVVAADFLTGNRETYEQMRKAPDALQFLGRIALSAGHPLTWVVYSGNTWLQVSKNMEAVEYSDPRAYPGKHVIGRVRLGTPKWVSSIVAWHLETPVGSAF